MIDDDTETVIVTSYRAADAQARVLHLIDRLRTQRGSPRQLMRQLQPYVVAIRKREASRLRRQGFIGTELLPAVGEWLGDYDLVRGITAQGFAPADLVI
jgi:hypothetical protein